MTMRIFRQSGPGDWEGMLSEVKSDLKINVRGIQSAV